MAEYTELLDSTKKTFDEVLDRTGIPNWVEFRLFGNSKLKNIYSIKKSSELVEKLSDGINITVIINEDVYEKLDEDQQWLVMEELLTGIHVNDNDKIIVNQPDISTHSGMLSKYGDATILKLKESIRILFAQEEEKEQETI